MSSSKIVQEQDKEVFETINKFVQKEMILNSIENTLEDDELVVLQKEIYHPQHNFPPSSEPMYLLFLAIAACYQDLITTLKSKIARLHELTKASTYYEFFNLKENCSDSEIAKAFRKLRKSTPPSHLTKDKFDELVMNGYSVLANYRKAYDNFLSDSKYIYITDPKNFKNYLVVILIAFVCVLVFIDFVIYGLRYLKYSERNTEYKKAKKSDLSVDGKVNKTALKMPPKMVSHRLIDSIRRLFKRRS